MKYVFLNSYKKYALNFSLINLYYHIQCTVYFMSYTTLWFMIFIVMNVEFKKKPIFKC